jgi:uncharacterized protein YndB with AHSA1/START domain
MTEAPMKLVHVTRSGTFHLPAAPERVFEFFSPEGERDWAPGWSPEYLHPADGRLQPGMVFRTAAGDEPTLWLLLRYDAATFEAQYVRIVPDSRLGTVTVRCSADGEEKTAVTVTYELTALSEAGNRALASLSPSAYEEMLGDWQTSIARLLPAGGADHC